MPAPKKKIPEAAPKRVRRTNAQIAADNLAAEQKRAALAAERASRIPAPITPKFIYTLHIVDEAGFTFGDKVYYRGEEITIEEGGDNFDLAFDRKGNFAFGLDENAQIEKYGKVIYREGPWTGLPYDLNAIYEKGQFDPKGNEITPAGTPAEVAALQKANKRRNLV